MKKNVAIVLLSAACLAFSFVKLAPSIRVGFIGDSITNGYGLKKKPGDIAALILTEKIGVRVYAINCGVDRSSTADWIEGSANLNAAQQRLKDALVVLVALGANDAYNSVQPSDYIANLNSCVRGIGEHRTIATQPPSVRAGGNMDAKAASLLASYWRKPAPEVELREDGVHPSANGNQQLAISWANVVLESGIEMSWDSK